MATFKRTTNEYKGKTYIKYQFNGLELAFGKLSQRVVEKYAQNGAFRYAVTLKFLDKDLKKSLSDDGIDVSLNETDDGNVYYSVNVTGYATNKEGEWNTPPKVVDGNRKSIDPGMVGRGSVIYVLAKKVTSNGKDFLMFDNYYDGPINGQSSIMVKKLVPFIASGESEGTGFDIEEGFETEVVEFETDVNEEDL